MNTPHILHVDLDAFFASVEQVLNPSLKGRPVVVGSAQESRGVVASASYEARGFGVRAGMPMFEALRLCPGAVHLAGSYREYERFGGAVFEILSSFSPTVEEGSLDEGYADLGGCERLYGGWAALPLARLPFSAAVPGVYVRREGRAVPPAGRCIVPDPWRWVAAVGLRIKRAVKVCTGLSVSVGCASNKLAARAASDHAKPNGLVLVEPGCEGAFFLRLALEDVPGLGRAVREKLRRWNVHTVAQARELPGALLRGALGERQGTFVYRALRGQGEDALARPARPRSISRESTFWTASNDFAFVEAMVFYLTERVGNAMRRVRLAGRTVHLKLRYEDFTTVEGSRSPRQPLSVDADIFAVARALLAARWRRDRRLRLVGVGVSNLGPAGGVQRRFFADDPARQHRLDGCLDALRERFGFGAVQRGPSILLAAHLRRDEGGIKLRTPALSR